MSSCVTHRPVHSQPCDVTSTALTESNTSGQFDKFSRGQPHSTLRHVVKEGMLKRPAASNGMLYHLVNTVRYDSSVVHHREEGRQVRGGSENGRSALTR